jgi:hypothetical protein
LFISGAVLQVLALALTGLSNTNIILLSCYYNFLIERLKALKEKPKGKALLYIL